MSRATYRETGIYLGDGLYADFDGYQIRLMAHDPVNPTHTVFLEPDVMATLIKYARGLGVIKETQ